jgi:hypothetical protein
MKQIKILFSMIFIICLIGIVSATAPTLTIYSPSGIYNYGNSSSILNFTWINKTGIITNAWYNYAGINYSFPSSYSTSNFIAVTGANGNTWTTHSGISVKVGMAILTPNYPIAINNLTIEGSSNPTWAYVQTALGSGIIQNTTCSGVNCIFSPAVVLNANTKYYILFDNAGNSYSSRVKTDVTIWNNSYFGYLSVIQNDGNEYALPDSNQNYEITNLTISNVSVVLNLSSYNKTFSQIYNNNNLTVYANNSAGEIGSAFTSWNYYLFENSQSFNSNTYQSSNEEFNINITADYNNYAVNGFLVYNGVSYSGTPTYSNGNIIFSRTINVGNSGTKNFYWNISLTNSTSTNYYQSNSNSQIVNGIVFGLCNSTLNITYLNISFADELNLSSINANIPQATFNYYTGNSSIANVYTFSNFTNNPSYAFCFNPSNININVQPNIQYITTGYNQRTYSANLNLTNSSTNQVLYLLNSGGQYVTFIVLSNNAPVQGASVSASRLINGIQTIVGSGLTDAAGTITMFLDYNYPHIIKVNANGYIGISESITPTLSQYPINLQASNSASNSPDFSNGITYSIQPIDNFLNQNSTYLFSYTISSTVNSLSQYGFTLYDSNNNTIDTEVSYSAIGGTVSYNYNILNNTLITMNYYYIVNGTTITGSRYWLTSSSSSFGIFNFFTDLSRYINLNMGGILSDDNGAFGKALISAIILIFVTGGLTIRYGINNNATIWGVLFGVVLFLNEMNFIPNPLFSNGFMSVIKLGDYITVIIFIIMVSQIMKEEYR